MKPTDTTGDGPDPDDIDRTRPRTERRRQSERDPSGSGAVPPADDDHDATRPARPRTSGRATVPGASGSAPETGDDATRRRPARTRPSTPAEDDAGAARASGDDDAAAAEDPLIGTTLGGCRIEERIGEGGMGTVYRARQLDLDREVAIKTIRSEYTADTEALRRFSREARAVGKFRTQHVVQVYQVGNERGVPYIVLEFVPGGNLRDRAEASPQGRIGPTEAVRFLRETALALADAAEKGIVHRDIKPDNLLLDERCSVKITDFGISKALQADMSMTLTQGGLVGTPMYMSPEQCRGEELDFRSDMWSLGATFFFLLTGQPPAKGSSLLELIQTRNKVRNLDPAKILPQAIPGPLSDVIRKLTMLDRDDRYPSYDALLADLDAIDAGRRNWRWVGGAARWSAAVLVLGGGSFAGYRHWDEIRAYVGSMFATTDEPEQPPEQDPQQPEILLPVLDHVAVSAQLDRIAEDIEQVDRGSLLANVGDRLREVRDELDSHRDSDEARELRERLAELEVRIGTRANELEFMDRLRGATAKLDALQQQIDAADDLAQTVRDIDELLGQLDTGESWDPLRERARGMRRAAHAAWYDERLDDAERQLLASGPNAAATLAETLVGELETESRAAEYEALRERARAIDHDAKAGTGFLRGAAGRPEPEAPFEELASWFRGRLDARAKIAATARTDVLAGWLDAQLRIESADPALAAAIDAELRRVWEDCRTARTDGDPARAQTALNLLDAALKNAATLTEVAIENPATAAERTALAEWIVASRASGDLLGDLERATTELLRATTLRGWQADRDVTNTARAQLRERAAQLEVDDPDAKARLDTGLARLDRGIAAWETVDAAARRALEALSGADLAAARATLAGLAPNEATPEPATIAEITAIRAAVDATERGFRAILVDLEPGPADRAFQAAADSLGPIPEADKSDALRYLRDCRESLARLVERTTSMAAVRGGEVVIGVNQPGIDKTEVVAAFYLDPHELDRATFKAALDGGAGSFPNVPANELEDLQRRDWDSSPRLPAVGISRNAAEDCLRSKHRSLPTHAEWWLAAAGPGASARFPWTERWAERRNQYSSSRPRAVDGDGLAVRIGDVETHFLLGNAAEWVSDAFGTYGIVVGGGFDSSPSDLQKASRGMVQSIPLRGRIRADAGCRGVIRPREHFGKLAPELR